MPNLNNFLIMTTIKGELYSHPVQPAEHLLSETKYIRIYFKLKYYRETIVYIL